jgi:hypothetical protein
VNDSCYDCDSAENAVVAFAHTAIVTVNDYGENDDGQQQTVQPVTDFVVEQAVQSVIACDV